MWHVSSYVHIRLRADGGTSQSASGNSTRVRTGMVSVGKSPTRYCRFVDRWTNSALPTTVRRCTSVTVATAAGRRRRRAPRECLSADLAGRRPPRRRGDSSRNRPDSSAASPCMSSVCLRRHRLCAHLSLSSSKLHAPWLRPSSSCCRYRQKSDSNESLTDLWTGAELKKLSRIRDEEMS